MKKALMTASVASMIDLFNMNNLKILKNLGYEVEVACNFENGSITSQERVNEFKKELIDDNYKVHHIPIPRSVFAFSDIIKSYRMMKNLCDENNYEIVHCHSPIGGIITRLVCMKVRKKGTKVIYTAHGFHFYKGAPLKNWFLFYPLEKICSRWTDVLITINKEDYVLAQKNMKAKEIEYMPGVGIDTERFKNTVVDKKAKRNEIGVPRDAFLILSVGELNVNKNHQIVIKAIAELGYKSVHYAVAGEGDQKEALEQLAEKVGVKEQLHLLGYRNDVAELYKVADVYALPSIREGLNVSVMEAMSSGLPCIVSKIRGNVDMVEDGINGYLYKSANSDAFAKAIIEMINDSKKRISMKNENLEKIKAYDVAVITSKIESIYKEILC